MADNYYYCTFKLRSVTGEDKPVLTQYGMRENGTFAIKRSEWKELTYQEALDFRPKTYGATHVGIFLHCETNEQLKFPVEWPYDFEEQRKADKRRESTKQRRATIDAIAYMVTTICILTIIAGAI